MASPFYIPYIGFFGQLTKTAASIDSIRAETTGAPYVTGHISHAGSVPIPFSAPIEGGESFLVGNYRFYFKDWVRTK